MSAMVHEEEGDYDEEDDDEEETSSPEENQVSELGIVVGLGGHADDGGPRLVVVVADLDSADHRCVFEP